MSKLSVTPECDCARAALPIDSPMPHVPGCPAYGYNEPLMKPPAPKPCNDCPWPCGATQAKSARWVRGS